MLHHPGALVAGTNADCGSCGSMFANPFVVGDGKDKYTVSESLDHWRYIEARAAPDATTERGSRCCRSRRVGSPTAATRTAA